MDKLTILSIVILFITIGASVGFHCPADTHCNCYKAYPDEKYSLDCLIGEDGVDEFRQPQLNMEIDLKKQRIVIQCSFLKSWNISHFPPLQIGAIKEIDMQYCNLPPEGFQQLFTKLGITSVKILSFEGTSSSDNVTLSAESFHGLSTLENLYITHVYPKFHERVFTFMPNLTDLDLMETNVQLTSTMFNTSTKLISLFLPLNKIQELPPGIFQPLHKLQHLHLWSNNIRMINRELFRTLNKLKSLELSRNAIDAIPAEVFDDLLSLETLSLVANQFQTLPANLFRHTQFLENIKLGSNPQLSALPEHLFKNLLNLKNVDLIECSLRTLPPKLFEGSRNIRDIFLERNGLQDLPEGIFDDLKYLEKLNLRDNLLSNLSDQIFHPLRQLHVLNLRNNSIAKITPALFSSLEALKTLDLSHNQIEHIPGFAFENNKDLRKLLLAGNKLQFVPVQEFAPSPFNKLVNVEEIDLSDNAITSLNVFGDLMNFATNLKQINLANNQLTHVEYLDFHSVSRNKVTIDLTANQIAVVDLSTAEYDLQWQLLDSPPSNVKMILANNPIACNCSNYDLMRYFDGTMNASVAKLLEIPSQDVNCLKERTPIKNRKSKTLLCPLEGSQCPNKCECFYRPFNKAFIVDCSKRNLTTIPDILLPSDREIEEVEIDVRNNLIKRSPTEGEGYENVTKLFMSNNTISAVSWLPKNIKVVQLDNNNLTAFDAEMLDVLRNSTLLSNLSLHNNPWRCDCEAEEFTSLLRSDLRRYVDVSNIRCSEDQRALINLNRKDLCSNETTVILVISTLFTSILFLIAALAAFYYCYQQEIKVWLFAHNMCLWFVTEEEVDKDKLYDAFISYSHQDEDFVVDKLVPILEEGPQPYKLCLHFRNWIAGEFISTQIANSVENSRRTIVVLSRNFLKSVWGKMEFRTAHTQAMSEGRARVIVVLLGDVNLEEELDDELKAYLKTNTYVKWGDPWFWDKLRYALPHSKLDKRRQINANLMISINDKLDLVGSPTTPNLGSTPPAVSLDPLLLKESPLEFKNGFKSQT